MFNVSKQKGFRSAWAEIRVLLPHMLPQADFNQKSTN
jgi:hypothetical protein